MWQVAVAALLCLNYEFSVVQKLWVRPHVYLYYQYGTRCAQSKGMNESSQAGRQEVLILLVARDIRNSKDLQLHNIFWVICAAQFGI
jgi:hypothetical protein